MNPAAAAVPASSQAGLQSSPPLGPPASLRLLPSGVLRQGDTEHLGAPGGGGGHWQRGWAGQKSVPRALELRASPCRTSCHLLRGGQALRSLVRVAELALSTGCPAITITIEQTVPCLPHTKHWKGPEAHPHGRDLSMTLSTSALLPTPFCVRRPNSSPCLGLLL